MLMYNTLILPILVCLPLIGFPSLTKPLGTVSSHFIVAKISYSFILSSSFLFSDIDCCTFCNITLHVWFSLSRKDSIVSPLISQFLAHLSTKCSVSLCDSAVRHRMSVVRRQLFTLCTV